MGLKAVNDPLESVFSTFTEALSTVGRVGLDGAAGQDQARFNNDMGRAHEYMVTGRKRKGRKGGRQSSNWFIPSTARGVDQFPYCDGSKACQGNATRFQQKTEDARGKVRAKGEVGKGEEAEGFKARLHECIIPSPAIYFSTLFKNCRQSNARI